ncbi:DUF6787 family protein [Fulvitalea axinellae]
MADITTSEEAPKGFINKMKKRWGVESTWSVIAILIVFSLTGMTVVRLRKVLFGVIGFDDATPFWIKTVTYILCVFPMYQGLILVYGFIFGQFAFFWEKEKKLGRLFVKLFNKISGKKA